MILLTEAYSPRNLGDGELVAASLDLVQTRYPNESVKIVALDQDGFARFLPHTEVIPRLFDRREFQEAARTARVLLALRWLVFMVAEAMFVRMGTRPGHFKWVLPSAARETVEAYREATRIVPVGGGYLGDRYVKESALTLWSWWWAGRSGAALETMPISVEAKGIAMRWLIRLFAPKRGICGRDSQTVRTLESLGKECSLVPDLAFRNANVVTTRHQPELCYIFPVAGDYYEIAVWQRTLRAVADALENVRCRAVANSMHLSLDGAKAGFDDEGAEFLVCASGGIEKGKPFESYQMLVKELVSSARVVITARMHAAIASLCAGVPVILLGYEEKHRSLAERLGLGAFYMPFDEVEPETLSPVLEAALALDREWLKSVVAVEANRLASWEGTRA